MLVPSNGLEPLLPLEQSFELCASTSFTSWAVVPRAGVEPAQPYGWQILSLLRLPIPPSGRCTCKVPHIVV